VQRDVAAAVRRAARLLADAGAVVDETARPGFRFEEAFEVFALLNHMLVAYSLPPKVRERVQRLASNFAPGDLSHRALQARGARMTPGAYQQVTMRKRRVEGLWARFFQRFDVVLCPPAPVLAIPHDPTPDFHARTIDIDGEKRPYLDFLVWASLAAGADLPAAVAPVMRNAQGLPAGVQIIAAKGEDRTAIAVAAMLETLGCRYEAPPLPP
jgi:amidase